MKLGLKTALEDAQFYDRFSRNPGILEIHLNEGDLFDKGRVDLERKITECQTSGIEVYLHHPISYIGKRLHILDRDVAHRMYYELSTRILIDICNEFKIKCVIHAHYEAEEFISNSEYREEIKRYESISNGCLLWENVIRGAFSSDNAGLYKEIIVPLNLRLCFDISHSYQSHLGDNDNLLNDLDLFKDHIDYFHIVDSLGKTHDSLELGKGTIDWGPVKKRLNGKPGIYEIGVSDPRNCSPMVRSHEYLLDI